MKRKFLAFLLAFVMVFSMLPVSALADETPLDGTLSDGTTTDGTAPEGTTPGETQDETPETGAAPVEIYTCTGGTWTKAALTQNSPTYPKPVEAALDAGEGTAALADDNWTAKLEGSTLTLKGLTIEDGFIHTSADINVVLDGVSTITRQTLKAPDGHKSGYVAAFEADDGEVTFSGGTLNATLGVDGTAAVAESDTTIYCGISTNDTTTVSSGTVNGTANVEGGFGVNVLRMAVSGGTVNGKANVEGGCGVLAVAFRISNSGKVNGTSQTGDQKGHCGVLSKSIEILDNGALSGTGDMIGIDCHQEEGEKETVITVDGGTMTGTGGNCGIIVSQLGSSSGTVTGTATSLSNDDDGWTNGIIGTDIISVGENGAINGIGGDRGIYVNSVITGGNGKLTGTGNSFGIQSVSQIRMEGGSVTGTGVAGTGICAVMFEISDGTMQGTGNDDYYGILSYSDNNEVGTDFGIKISGGKFIAKGGWYALMENTSYPLIVRASKYTYKLGEAAEQNGPCNWETVDNTQDLIITCNASITPKPDPNPNPAPEPDPDPVVPDSDDNSSSNTTTETVKNPDGSTTTTTENKTTGTVTETTKNPDGSSTVVETKKDGTVTTTEKDASGNQTKTEEKPDGSSNTQVKQKDGSTSTTKVDAAGQVTADVELSKTAISEAKNEPVTLPMPQVPVTDDRDTAPTVTVALPSSSKDVKVEIPVENVTPGTVAVIVKADGTEEVVKTSVTTENGVAVKLNDGDTVKIVDNSKTYTDVPASNWASGAVAFASSRELFQGTSETQRTFSPNVSMTRGMLVTVLARFDGHDTTADAGQTWYDKGVAWAQANNVSDGSNPTANITREQMVAMIWRYAGSPAASGSLDAYPDAGNVSAYASDAMAWAVSIGLINGVDGALQPQGNATRAQVATIMMRYVEQVAAK